MTSLRGMLRAMLDEDDEIPDTAETDELFADQLTGSIITVFVEWLRLDDTKKAIYAAQEGTGTGPPLVSITEALVRAAQEEP